MQIKILEPESRKYIIKIYPDMFFANELITSPFIVGLYALSMLGAIGYGLLDKFFGYQSLVFKLSFPLYMILLTILMVKVIRWVYSFEFILDMNANTIKFVRGEGEIELENVSRIVFLREIKIKSNPSITRLPKRDYNEIWGIQIIKDNSPILLAEVDFQLSNNPFQTMLEFGRFLCKKLSVPFIIRMANSELVYDSNGKFKKGKKSQVGVIPSYQSTLHTDGKIEIEDIEVKVKDSSKYRKTIISFRPSKLRFFFYVVVVPLIVIFNAFLLIYVVYRSGVFIFYKNPYIIACFTVIFLILFRFIMVRVPRKKTLLSMPEEKNMIVKHGDSFFFKKEVISYPLFYTINVVLMEGDREARVELVSEMNRVWLSPSIKLSSAISLQNVLEIIMRTK